MAFEKVDSKTWAFGVKAITSIININRLMLKL